MDYGKRFCILVLGFWYDMFYVAKTINCDDALLCIPYNTLEYSIYDLAKGSGSKMQLHSSIAQFG